MTTRCAICNHRLVRDADSMFNQGASAAAVARMLGASVQSAKRHRHSGHVTPPALVAPPNAVNVAPRVVRKPIPSAASSAAPADPTAPSDPAVAVAPMTPAEQLEVLRDDLDSMLKGAISPTARLAIIAERRRVIETMYRVVGPAAPAMIRLEMIEGYAELEADEMSALEEFPLARQALARVLRERLAAMRGETRPRE
jgi:hypothetical protein